MPTAEEAKLALELFGTMIRWREKTAEHRLLVFEV
jgi:hypothetical protein